MPDLLICLNANQILILCFFFLEKSYYLCTRFSEIDRLKARRDGRVVDYNGLENRRAERHRGFESLSLRNPSNQKSLIHNGLATFFSLCSPTFRFFVGTGKAALSGAAFVGNNQQKPLFLSGK